MDKQLPFISRWVFKRSTHFPLGPEAHLPKGPSPHPAHPSIPTLLDNAYCTGTLHRTLFKFTGWGAPSVFVKKATSRSKEFL